MKQLFYFFQMIVIWMPFMTKNKDSYSQYEAF